MQPNGCGLHARIHTYVRAHAHASRSLARVAGKLERSLPSPTGGRRYRVGSTKEMSTRTSGTIPHPPRPPFVFGPHPPLPSPPPRCAGFSLRDDFVAIKRGNAFPRQTPLPRDHFRSRDRLSEFFGLIRSAPPPAAGIRSRAASFTVRPLLRPSTPLREPRHSG